MKKLFMLLLVCFLSSCAYTADDLKEFVRDPRYAEYQQKLDNLERSYLNGQITYSDYLKQKQQVDDGYNKEVQKREEIIHQQPVQ